MSSWKYVNHLFFENWTSFMYLRNEIKKLTKSCVN